MSYSTSQRDVPLWRRDDILDAVHEDLIKVVNRIEAGEQVRLSPWADRQRGFKKEDHEDTLEIFPGSTVQKEIETHSEFIDGYLGLRSGHRAW